MTELACLVSHMHTSVEVDFCYQNSPLRTQLLIHHLTHMIDNSELGRPCGWYSVSQLLDCPLLYPHTVLVVSQRQTCCEPSLLPLATDIFYVLTIPCG